MAYSCEDAKRDIDLFFSKRETTEETKKTLQIALEHMTEGSTVQKHNVSCSNCWNYYQEMKRKYCGG